MAQEVSRADIGAAVKKRPSVTAYRTFGPYCLVSTW
jgi:hypothetical protein